MMNVSRAFCCYNMNRGSVEQSSEKIMLEQ